MIKLYGVPISYNISKIRYCLNYLGLDYQLESVSPMKGENQTPEYLAISPTGKIPAIDDNGFTLFESNTINRYLAASNNSDIYPTDLKERAEVDAWLDYGSIHVGAAFSRVVFNRVLAPVIGAQVDEGSLNTGLEFLDKQLPVIDRQLSKSKYIAGESFTIADICLLAVLDPAELASIDLSAYTNIVKWRDDLKSQDFYQQCYSDFTAYVKEAMLAMAE